MTVKKAGLAAGGRQVKGTFNGLYINNLGQMNVTGQVVFYAWTDTATESPLMILNSGEVPRIGDNYVEAGQVFRNVIYKSATPRYIGVDGNLFKWSITYDLEGLVTQYDGEDPPPVTNDDPVLLDFSFSVDKNQYAEIADLDGRINANSLGEYFSDPLIFNEAVVNFEFHRTEYDNPLTLADAFYETYNVAPIWGLRAGTLRVLDINASANVTAARTSWNVVYRLQYRRRGWLVEKANTSLYAYDATARTITRITNADGSPTEQPCLINYNGTLWQGGTVPTLSFRTLYPRDFAGLDLPNPFDL